VARDSRPTVMNNYESLQPLLEKAYNLTTAGKFTDSLNSFREILWHIPLIVLNDTSKENEVHGIIRKCIDYIIGIKC